MPIDKQNPQTKTEDKFVFSPFALYFEQLETMGKLITSQCDASLALLKDFNRTALETTKTTVSSQASDKVSDTQRNPLLRATPSAHDFKTVATTMTTAINDAAKRNLAHAQGQRDDLEELDPSTPVQPSKRYKPSISAVKTVSRRTTSRRTKS